MRGTIAIFRRELLSYFVSPVAYFVITGFALLSGYFFFNLLGYYNIYLRSYSMYQMMGAGAGGPAPNLNQIVVEPYYFTLIIILVFLVPLLTMRSFAEEKRRGTFELLITSPLSVGNIVIGKFLSLAFMVILMILVAFSFPWLLFYLGKPGPELLPTLSGLVAVLLCALGFSAVGMAVSSFTENQIVAGVSSMVTLLLLYVIHSPAETLQGPIADVLNYLSPIMQAKDMIRGVVSLKNFVYFLSLISFGLFLSQRALEAHRWR